MNNDGDLQWFPVWVWNLWSFGFYNIHDFLLSLVNACTITVKPQTFNFSEAKPAFFSTYVETILLNFLEHFSLLFLSLVYNQDVIHKTKNPWQTIENIIHG